MFSKRTYRRNKPKQSTWLESSDQTKEISFIPPIQTKLNIGEPGDIYEKEADNTADKVIENTSESPNVQKMEDRKEEVQAKGMANQLTPFVQQKGDEKEEVQTKCNDCVEEEKVQKKEEEEAVQSKEEEPMQMKEEEEESMQMKEEEESMQMKEEEEKSMQMKEEEEESVQMKEEDESMQMKEEEESMQMKEEGVKQSSKGQSTVAKNIESKLSTNRGGGHTMDSNTRGEMEHSFGNDFSDVKIHTGEYAKEMNKNLKARAFTNGNDIYFNSGQYDPNSKEGKHLLAHELTHTIQQNGSTNKNIQADYAVAPTTPNRESIELTPEQIREAIEFNSTRHTNVAEISEIRMIIGLGAEPATIDEDFVRALAEYQTEFGLTIDGKLGHGTANRLAMEIQATADFMGPDELGSLAPEFEVQTNVQNLIDANNNTYADYRDVIQPGTMIQRHIALNTTPMLIALRGLLSWNNWARCIELLGRQIPTGNQMRRNPVVRAAMRTAFTESNPGVTRWSRPRNSRPDAARCNPRPGDSTTTHEEGGFIYLNLITGNLTTRRVPRGRQALIPLDNSPDVHNSIVVGGFHTHPNLGFCWGEPIFSDEDRTWSVISGVPLLMIGAYPGIGDVSFHTHGASRRHIAGNRGVPGAAGGLAPQSSGKGFDRP